MSQRAVEVQGWDPNSLWLQSQPLVNIISQKLFSHPNPCTVFDQASFGMLKLIALINLQIQCLSQDNRFLSKNTYCFSSRYLETMADTSICTSPSYKRQCMRWAHKTIENPGQPHKENLADAHIPYCLSIKKSKLSKWSLRLLCKPVLQAKVSNKASEQQVWNYSKTTTRTKFSQLGK